MNAFEMELLIIPRVTPGSAFKNHIIFKLLWLAFYFQDILKKRNNPRGVVGGSTLGLFHKFPIFKNSSQEIRK